MFIITIPQTDLSKTPLSLPKATLKNCGGYKLPLDNKTFLPTYSPIDLSVCGLTALYNGEQSITDLSAWFIQNEFRVAETFIHVTVCEKEKILTHSITEWKHHSQSNNKILRLFNKNAPFTFRRKL